MPLKTDQRPDEILGYELKDRLGAGGYGEVWRAEAPGGIAKAIKLIYGYHDENRATRELRALNRVKELRHPFLLSLDRIDVVNGQLVIVTEMADCCLKDRFDECREQGLPGIPRDELLRCLRDAADALDFIGVEHSLQHLDVKPENLLLVSGHVKVADFGLVKEITDASQSLMGGLTPAYSPPELFDGRPCHASDQYSLAIVYQEMLTGERPFPGTTAAQLASQHMNIRPQLGALPRGDQKVVAKALAKDPGRRYASCVSFIDELSDRQANQLTTGSFKRPGRRPASVARRSPEAGNSTHCVTRELPSSLLPTKRTQAVVNKLPPVATDPEQAAQRPNLLIGIGHTGVTVMRELRREMRTRWGADQHLPAVRVLGIDTDEKDLIRATLGKVNESLRPEETLPIPLRRPEEYRKNDADLSWISRRWLYNIPRSLQTEGVRPLGRLAFADHHRSILDKIHEAVEDITGEGILEETATTTGLNRTDPHPQVFLVASIAGGVGSGCMLDMAYAVRTVLLEHGLDDSRICGVLVHASGASSALRDLTSANTYACLSELQHYTRVEAYPGDESCGLPAYGEEHPPFSSTYFVDLGDNLLPDEYENATQSIARYLLLNTVTSSSVFFDECRRPGDFSDETVVRAFGTSGGVPPGYRRANGNLPHDLVTQRLCDQLLRGWSGESAEHFMEIVPLEFAETQCAKFGLDPDGTIRRGNELVVDALGRDLQGRLDAAVQTVLVEHRKLSTPHDREVFAAEIKIAIDQVLGEPTTVDRRFPVPLAAVRSVAVDWFSPLQSVIRALVDQPAARMDAALRANKACQQRLHDLAEQFVTSIEQTDQELATTHAAISSKPAESRRGKVAAACQELGQSCAHLRLQQLVLTASLTLIREMQKLCQDFAQEQSEFAGRVQRFATACRTIYRPAELAAEDLHEGDREATSQEVESPFVRMVRQLDKNVQQTIADTHGGLANLVESDEAREPFSQSLVLLARQLATQAANRIDRDPAAERWAPSNPETVLWLRNRLQLAEPSGTRYGGGLRLLLASPEACPAEDFVQVLKTEFDEHPSVVPAIGGELTVCYEMSDIRLTDIALSLLENRPDCAEFVRRLHARNDVDWSPLTGVL